MGQAIGQGVVLPDHAESEVRRRRSDAGIGAFERNRRVKRAEQWGPGADQDRDHVHVDLVHETERQRLLHDGRAEQMNDLVACDAQGNIDVNDLKAKAAEHKANLGALMIT